MREALGDVEQPNDGYTAGWVWSYPLKAALEEWLDGDYDKDRAGLLEAVKSLETVDYEGMLPEEAGNRSGDPNETVFRETRDQQGRQGGPDRASPSSQDFSAGPTAEDHEFEGACFEGCQQLTERFAGPARVRTRSRSSGHDARHGRPSSSSTYAGRDTARPTQQLGDGEHQQGEQRHRPAAGERRAAARRRTGRSPAIR